MRRSPPVDLYWALPWDPTFDPTLSPHPLSYPPFLYQHFLPSPSLGLQIPSPCFHVHTTDLQNSLSSFLLDLAPWLLNKYSRLFRGTLRLLPRPGPSLFSLHIRHRLYRTEVNEPQPQALLLLVLVGSPPVRSHVSPASSPSASWAASPLRCVLGVSASPIAMATANLTWALPFVLGHCNEGRNWDPTSSFVPSGI